MMEQMLKGIKVLDFSTNAAGPLASAPMADYGAYVVKVEKPAGADERSFGAQDENGVSFICSWLNRGKKSITLDLKDERAVTLVKKMILDFDVLVESARPGVMERLGLGYEEIHKLNPSLVYCSVSTYGQAGPYREKPGYDLLAQAMSGLMDTTGDPGGPPVQVGYPIGDYISGLNAFACIMAALLYRQRTGKGQHIDVSLLNSLVYLNSNIDYVNTGRYLTRNGSHSPSLSPYGVFMGKDHQSIIIGALNPKMWAALCGVMGRPELTDDERYNTLQKRVAVREEVVEIIESWLMGFDDISDAQKLLESVRIPCGKVYDVKDMLADPQFKENELIITAPAPDNSSRSGYVCRNVNAKFSETPGQIHKAPALGQDNHEILTQYGLSDEEITALEASWGVVC